MAGIVNPEGTWNPDGTSSDGGWHLAFPALLVALEALAVTVGHFDNGGFCVLCWGYQKITIPWGGSIGNITIPCPACGGDGNMFA